MTEPTPPTSPPQQPGDWAHAPDHLVAMVAALAPMPDRLPVGDMNPQAWYSQLRRVVDEIWATGWMAGAADHAACTPPPPMVVTVAGAETVLRPAVVAGAERSGRARPVVSPSQRTRS